MSSGTHQLSGRSRLFLLAALTTLSPFATDTVVPGLDAIAAGLDVTQAQAQQTLSTYMFGVALMALFHGAISDAVGRRPVVLVGLALFSVAALGCALAGDIQMLIVLRFIQGLAGGAGMIVVRAMVRDALDGPPAQRLLSQVMFVFAVAPAIAPIIGGFAVAEFGWRSIFWFFFAGSAVLLVWTAFALPETHPPAKRTSLAPAALVQGYRAIFGRGEFFFLTATAGFAFQVFFLYVGAANLFLKGSLGLNERQFAYLFIPVVAGFMTGAIISGRSAGHWSRKRTVQTAFVLIAVPVAFNVIYHYFNAPTLWSAITPIALSSVGIALVGPIIQIMILDLFPDRRGMAASAQASLQLATSGINLAVVSLALGGSAFLLALGQLGWLLASVAAWSRYVLGRKRRARLG